MVAGTIEEETPETHCSSVTVKHDDCHATLVVYVEVVCDSEESGRLSDAEGGLGAHELGFPGEVLGRLTLAVAENPYVSC